MRTTDDYTVAELAVVLNLTPSAVLMRIRRGQIQAYKRGSMWFITREEGAKAPARMSGRGTV